MARPTKRTAETEKRILDLLRAGNTRRASCIGARVSEDTFARWLKSSADFAEHVARAEEDAAIRNVAVIQKCAMGGSEIGRKVVEKFDKEGRLIQKVTETSILPPNWNAAAWWLERRRKEDYSPKIETEGGAGAPIEVTVRYVDAAGKTV